MTSPMDAFQKTGITLKMLIDSGLLNADQEIFCINPIVKGIVRNDGTIAVGIDDKK